MKNFKSQYLLFPLTVILAASSGSFITSAGMDWYKSINIPSWTPPGYVIGIVWTIIFSLLTVSMLLAWTKFKNNGRFQSLALIFVLNLALNMGWSYLFFGQHEILLATYEAGLLGFSVLAMILTTWPISKLAGILLFPYMGWVAFATYLTYSVYQLNV